MRRHIRDWSLAVLLLLAMPGLFWLAILAGPVLDALLLAVGSWVLVVLIAYRRIGFR